jgi:hypothetical protein
LSLSVANLLRYKFSKEQELGEPIEIEDDDDWVDPKRKFYWNPYSGELSLEFPKPDATARGGILADAMGELLSSIDLNLPQAWARRV